MLQSLRIQNFALIEETEIHFNNGLTVITGETGAGKSILLGALGLTLGHRADVNVLNNKQKKCIIEARFHIAPYQLNSFFDANELDYEDITTIRREITVEGKSRAFVNDTPVTLAVIKALSEQLIDIHSQHETILLKENQFQLELVDAFAKTKSDYAQYKIEYAGLQKLKKQLAVLIEKETQAKKEFDYVQFQFSELEEANIKIGELVSLETESEALENAEFIKGHLVKASEAINGGDENMLSVLAQVKQGLQSISKYGAQFNELNERIHSLSIELKELNADIMATEDDVVYDNEKLEIVNTQLDKLNKLLKKHQVKTEEELLNIKQTFEDQLQQFSSIETHIEKVKKEITVQYDSCLSLAKNLSKQRKASVSDIEAQVKSMLASLSMPHAQFHISMSELDEFSINGLDKIEFLFSANKGQDFKEIGKAASGGELSRLMLCLKSLLAERTLLPSIVFDEIDTGVSGDVADKIGIILEQMGSSLQVIVITHLPQMASKGENHLFVYKTDQTDRTTSHIKVLQQSERIEEIAKMLSSGKPTEAALKNAKELLKL